MCVIESGERGVAVICARGHRTPRPPRPGAHGVSVWSIRSRSSVDEVPPAAMKTPGVLVGPKVQSDFRDEPLAVADDECFDVRLAQPVKLGLTVTGRATGRVAVVVVVVVGAVGTKAATKSSNAAARTGENGYVACCQPVPRTAGHRRTWRRSPPPPR